MKKRELLQAIERMPHEAEVEYPTPMDAEGREVEPPLNFSSVRYVEYVNGKIRLS